MSKTATLNQEQTQRLINRIEHNVEIDPDTGCWIWKRYKNKVNGYGQFWIGLNEQRKNIWMNAHRASYELFWGPVPEGKEVAHTCHCRECVNPNHLVAATHKENVWMSILDGRRPSKQLQAQ